MFIWDIYKWEKRKIDYTYKKMDDIFSVQIIEQTHRNEKFSGFVLDDSPSIGRFLSKNCSILLSSGGFPAIGSNRYINCPFLPEEFHGSYQVIWLRGNYNHDDDEKIMMWTDIFERFQYAVEEYNTAFSTKII